MTYTCTKSSGVAKPWPTRALALASKMIKAHVIYLVKRFRC